MVSIPRERPKCNLQRFEHAQRSAVERIFKLTSNVRGYSKSIDGMSTRKTLFAIICETHCGCIVFLQVAPYERKSIGLQLASISNR